MLLPWSLASAEDRPDRAPAVSSHVPIPVTSYEVDVGDDPENGYSGAPQFDWAFFGNQTRLITKSPSNYLRHRNTLGIEHAFYFLESKSFGFPPSPVIDSVIRAAPVIPVIQFANIGKINRTAEDGEKGLSYDPAVIRAFQSHYPNLIMGGGQTAEVDGDFAWLYKQYYGRLPTGPGGRSFPAVYNDFIESNLKRSGVPFLMQQHNQSWGIHYVAKERAMSLSAPQLFYRRSSSIVNSLVTSRSAARQYPHPFGVQFSGQPILEIANAGDVIDQGAEPVYQMGKSRFGANYGKSYALARQVLYLSWLNGARFFNWEGREFMDSKAAGLPTPLGTFTKEASKIISEVGPTGPVQTPVAIISEFSNSWQPPEIRTNGTIGFDITGDSSYRKGDHQLHALRDFFHPHYLQCETIYKKSMGEDYALTPTPFGDSVDFLLSDVRPAALQRYGLLIWGGVPPEAPTVVREKLLKYIDANHGKVILFGASARRMFPEWFDERPAEVVGPGALVSYAGRTIGEKSDFLVDSLRAGLDTEALSMKVLAEVNGKPLAVECLGGLILILSDHGVNRSESVPPALARWQEDRLVTEIPYHFLTHVNRLLDDEILRISLFSVSNRNLHFVTTRPKAGEYLVGIFNDKLTSEPFSITTNIGRITSLTEVPLPDSKQGLKAAAGGAAYAPPGLRSSPRLPLDYGLSDRSNIEGRDFRLFRIQMDEVGVRNIPSFQYPGRPVGRVLAVAGLEYIRSYIQGIPSFFQWFDGVKVDAHDLLSIADGRLAEQAQWLERRGVRVAIDCSGIDEKTVLQVLEKLTLVRGKWMDLVIVSPSGKVQTAAALQGVRLLDPSTVNRLPGNGEGFSKEASLNIVDLHYASEEGLYLDLRNFLTGNVAAVLHGKPYAVDYRLPLPATNQVSEDFIYVGPEVHSLKELLEHDESGFRRFRGIKVDATYLLSKTAAELSKDGAKLKQLGLECIIDLRRDQMHHDAISFYPHIPGYQSGMRLYEEILLKMQTIGAGDLIVGVQDVGGMRNEAKYIAERDATWQKFASLADAGNIDLHLIFELGLKFSNLAEFSRPNVFVIAGSKGNPSPFTLMQKSGNTGSGRVKVYDNDAGAYSSGFLDPTQTN